MTMEGVTPLTPTQINTNGGAFVDGAVMVTDGDFVGRDQIIQHIDTFIQQALSAAEEAEQARSFAKQRLATGVHNYAQRLALIFQAEAERAGNPYRGLAAYRLNDNQRFFGRQQAIADLLARMDQAKLTILHAESGAGKSSLLQAGVAAHLLAAGHLPMLLRPNAPPVLKIQQEFLPDLTVATKNDSLREFLRTVTAVLGPKTRLYLLFDQFEEFFSLVTNEARTEFINTLADCLDDKSLPVHWVLALRSDSFGELATFRPQVRNPFENDYHLKRLTRLEACTVITEPARGKQFALRPTW